MQPIYPAAQTDNYTNCINVTAAKPKDLTKEL